MKNIPLVILFVTFFLAPVMGESTWRGQAGVAASASLPESGLYAATNEFPRGTILEVRNLRNNTTLKLQVLKRSPSALDLNFIYLSSQAGRELDIRTGESVLVSVSVLETARAINTSPEGVASLLTAPEGELKPLTTPTPETWVPNPTTVVEVPVLVSPAIEKPVLDEPVIDLPSVENPVPELVLAETTGPKTVEVTPVPQGIPGALDLPEVVLAPEVVVTHSPVIPSPTEIPEPTLDRPALGDMAVTTPPVTPGVAETPTEIYPLSEPSLNDLIPSDPRHAQDALVMDEPGIPVVPELTVVINPVETPVETPPETDLVQTVVSKIPEVQTLEPGVKVSDIPAVPLAEIKPLDKNPVVTAVVGPNPETPVVTTDLKDKTPLATLPGTSSTTRTLQSSRGDLYVAKPQGLTTDPLGDVKLITQLARDGDYIQLGAFRDQDILFKTLEKISSYVPLAVWVPEGSVPSYRLMAGPLRRDQLGLLFKHYQDQGFRDAVIIKRG